MRQKHLLTAAAALALLAATPAIEAAAQQPPTAAAPAAPVQIQLPAWFLAMDVDKDGYVTRAEFLAARLKTFDALDSDKDGFLTREEFLKMAEPPFTPEDAGSLPLAIRQRHFAAQFQSMDIDRDEKLSREEMEAFAALAFAEFDLNKDDRISTAEVLAHQQNVPALPPGAITLAKFLEVELRNLRTLDANQDGKISLEEFLALAGPPDNDPKAKGLPPLAERRARVTARFQEWDLDKDRFLERDELLVIFTNRFAEIDRNGDGVVTEDEVRAHMEASQRTLPPAPPITPVTPTPPAVAPTPTPAAPQRPATQTPRPPQQQQQPAPQRPATPPPPTTLRPGG